MRMLDGMKMGRKKGPGGGAGGRLGFLFKQKKKHGGERVVGPDLVVQGFGTDGTIHR